jgi:hypothetical protein
MSRAELRRRAKALARETREREIKLATLEAKRRRALAWQKIPRPPKPSAAVRLARFLRSLPEAMWDHDMWFWRALSKRAEKIVEAVTGERVGGTDRKSSPNYSLKRTNQSLRD